MNDENKKILIRFLKDNDCYKYYIHNRICHIGSEKLKTYLENNSFFTSIMASFDWATTTEGFEFWRKKYSEFIKIFKQTS